MNVSFFCHLESSCASPDGGGCEIYRQFNLKTYLERYQAIGHKASVEALEPRQLFVCIAHFGVSRQFVCFSYATTRCTHSTLLFNNTQFSFTFRYDSRQSKCRGRQNIAFLLHRNENENKKKIEEKRRRNKREE